MVNKEILIKLKNKTQDDSAQREFLTKIFQFEDETRGWYDKEYNKFLEEIVPRS
jgi:hypothetical protein